LGAQEEALSFDKPELAFDMRANTFVLQGTAVKKPMVEILQDLVSTLDLSKRSKEGEAEPKEGEDDDLGVSTDVDFSAPAQPETSEAAIDVGGVD
jgi:nascent polypeptide-associated complex subunit beta